MRQGFVPCSVHLRRHLAIGSRSPYPHQLLSAQCPSLPITGPHRQWPIRDLATAAPVLQRRLHRLAPNPLMHRRQRVGVFLWEWLAGKWRRPISLPRLKMGSWMWISMQHLSNFTFNALTEPWMAAATTPNI